MLLIYSADTAASGIWAELSELQDPELKRLADSLPSTVLHSRADSTVGKYGHAFRRWKTWAEARSEVFVFPVREVHFALYLQHVGDTIHSWHAMKKLPML